MLQKFMRKIKKQVWGASRGEGSRPPQLEVKSFGRRHDSKGDPISEAHTCGSDLTTTLRNELAPANDEQRV